MKVSLTRLFAFFFAVVSLAAVNASPLNTTSAKPAVTAPPHFVVYWDKWVAGENGPPDPSAFNGYNVLALSFLLSNGPADQATEWVSIGADTRAATRKQYNDAGIKIIASAFGATDSPTSQGHDPSQLAQSMAAWVKEYDVDGIDVDYEDFNAVNAGTAAQWLITFTTVLRQNLPQGQYIITHAPVAPWFSSTTGGPYLTVDRAVGNMIDWYNVQFYSQGPMYTTCDGLVSNSGGPFTQSSIFEIHQAGVDLDKIVVGKPATPADATGYLDPGELATCIQQAKSQGWNAGVMVWQFPDAGTDWIQTVRSI